MALSRAKLFEEFEYFLKSYQTPEGTLGYREQISQMISEQRKSVIINYEDLTLFNPDLAVYTIERPDEVIREFKEAAFETIKIENPAFADWVHPYLKIRIKTLPDRLNLRVVLSKYIDKLISVGGMVVRTSEIKPMLLNAAFVCPSGHITFVEQKSSMLKKPQKCSQCNEVKSLEIDNSKSIFTDYQTLRLQELPEELPPGQLPQYVDIDVDGDLVNTARPGDRVVMTGIMRAESDLANRGARSNIFLTKLEGLYVEELGKSRDRVEITPEDEEKIRLLAQEPGIYEKLVSSIAPGIYGYEHIKEALLLLSVGSPQQTLPDGETLRGDINMLLVGDPGTAKSEMLKYIARIAPRALYTSGRGTTAAGLTAAVVKEKSGIMMLEAGAVVLADQGIACIDEFDKMKAEDRGVLHEVMEQQSYHPSMEILLASGRKVRIGDYVDQIFNSSGSTIIQGKNCQIVQPEVSEEIYSYNFDLGSIKRVKITKVSRHLPPDHFIMIGYSNGRSIFVTPEHPVYVWRNGQVIIVRADDIRSGDLVPAPNSIPWEYNETSLLAPVKFSNKMTNLPSSLSAELAQLLGYLIDEGSCEIGNPYEIRFSHKNTDILKSIVNLMYQVFEVMPSSVEVNGNLVTQIYISKLIYEFLSINFPEIMDNDKMKRIPAAIMGAPTHIAKYFLAVLAFINYDKRSNNVCYKTVSKGLAEDYQDLLLKVGIHSQLHNANDNFFEVYIDDDFTREFFILVTQNCHLPYDQNPLIRSRRELSYKAEYNDDIDTKDEEMREVDDENFNFVQDLNSCATTTLSHNNLLAGAYNRSVSIPRNGGENILIPNEMINYSDNETYLFENSTLLSQQSVQESMNKITDNSSWFKSKYPALRLLKVMSVQVVKNEGEMRAEWVYDVTVEPNHNFISHGLVLHNTVSVAKGGIVATLNARTSILAASNPLMGRYDAYKNIYENINLPVALLTRFDLIYILRDIPNVEQDEKLAQHILTTHKRKEYAVTPPIDFSLLRKYMAYVKGKNPVLTDEAVEKIKAFYLEMRTASQDGTIAITPRQLETMVRLATARARVELEDMVTIEDANRAIDLLKIMLQEVGMDVRTKKIDIGGVLQGKPASERTQMEKVIAIFKRLCGPENKEVAERSVLDELAKVDIDANEGTRLIQSLQRNGQIYERSPGKYSLTIS